MLFGQMERQRWLLWATFLSFPLGFVATLTGWFTAEVGRQPWTVYGQLRTADAATPFLTTSQVTTSLILFGLVYALIFLAGTAYIYRLLRQGIVSAPQLAESDTNPKRPMAIPGDSPGAPPAPGPAEAA
jgi:cytochrome bd ubiquinol oxidase subunit I